MNERDFGLTLQRMMVKRRLYWHHCLDSRKCHGMNGMPDYIVVGPGGVAFIEIKVGMNDLQFEQRQWRLQLIANGMTYRLWKPAQLDSGEIEAFLDWLATEPAERLTFAPRAA